MTTKKRTLRRDLPICDHCAACFTCGNKKPGRDASLEFLSAPHRCKHGRACGQMPSGRTFCVDCEAGQTHGIYVCCRGDK